LEIQQRVVLQLAQQPLAKRSSCLGEFNHFDKESDAAPDLGHENQKRIGTGLKARAALMLY